MLWYDYIICFIAAAIIANFVPHFVQGIAGKKFPTPFAKPPGKGLSSPVVNVLWGLLNLLIGLVLLRGSAMDFSSNLALIVFFAGFAAAAIALSKTFAGVTDRKI